MKVLDLHLNQRQQTRLMAFARQTLHHCFGLETTDKATPPDDSDVITEQVHINLREGGRLRGVGNVAGKPLNQAIAEGVRQALYDEDHGGALLLAEVPTTSIEVWVQTRAERVEPPVLEHVRANLWLGIHGVSVKRGRRQAYFLPSVPILYNLRKRKNLLAQLCLKAGLEPDAWQDADVAVYLTHWLHLVEAPHRKEGVVVLSRLRRAEAAPVSPETVEAMMWATTDRLVSTQRANGSYTYLYDALKHEIRVDEFNQVRMAGTTYAIAQAAAYAQDPERVARYEASARRGLAFLEQYAMPLPDAEDASFIALGKAGSQRFRGKLGSTALTLLALQFGSFPEAYAALRTRLRQAICHLQNPDGSFQCFIHRPNHAATNHNYYPGEALLALCHEAKRSHDPTVHMAIKRAFPFHEAYFSHEPDTAFVLWQVDVWRLFHNMEAMPHAQTNGHEASAMRESPYARFVFQQIDWLLQLQYTPENATCPDYIGGFSIPRRPSSVTATYVEALIRACGLAHQIGAEEHYDRYREAALHGLQFMFRLHITPDEAFLFERPDLTLGGVTSGMTSFEMRCDRDQHAITAYQAALETPSLFAA